LASANNSFIYILFFSSVILSRFWHLLTCSDPPTGAASSSQIEWPKNILPATSTHEVEEEEATLRDRKVTKINRYVISAFFDLKLKTEEKQRG